MKVGLWLFDFCAVLCVALSVHAAEPVPSELSGVGISPNLGVQISLNTPFVDESGHAVTLAKYFDGNRPIILVLAYYGCPMLCGLVLNSVKDALQDFEWKIGEKFTVVTISIDPNEGPDLALAKKQRIIADWKGKNREQVELAWHFLTARKENSEKIAEEVGFKYRYDTEEKQYAHSAGIFIVSPKGRLTRVLFGIQYLARDLKLALLEASEGKIGNIAEKILLFCYSYDPKANKYALLATRVMRAGGGVTVFVIAVMYVGLYFRRRQSQVKG